MKAQYRSGLLVLITFSRIRCSLTFLHGYVASSTSINRSPLSLSPSLDPGLASRNAITSTRIGSGGNSAIEEGSQNNNAHSSPTIAIVGAGVGGLSIASRVAASPDLPPSTKIVILEKNSHEKVGGRCGSFFRDVPGFGKFRFERGPSLLLLRDVYLDLFRDCGKDAKDFGLDIKQCNPAYQVVFDDGDAIQLGFPKKANLINDNVKKLEEISRRKMDEYENNGSTKWDEYMRATEAFLDCGLPNFIEERFDLKSFPSFIIEATRDGLKSWPLKAHSEVLDKTFASNKMKALASFQDLYVGLEPYKNNNQIGGGVLKKSAPAVFGLLAALELHPTNDKAGVFAPLGGFQKVSQAFEKLALDSGVEIHYNKNVESITSDGIFYSHLDGDSSDRGTPEFLPADMIIVNADLPYSTKTLLNNSKKEQQVSPPQPSIPRYDWDDKFDFSSGVIAFYFSVKKKCDSLNTHNVFLVSSSRSKMEKSWSAVRDNDPTVSSFDDVNFPFNFYVHRASGTDGSAAPSNCDSLMVLVPCCTLKRDEYLAGLPRDESIAGYKEQFDNEFISKVKDIVLQRLGVLDGLEDLQSNIVDEVVETPATYADSYNVGAGTPFALSHGFEQLSLTRPGQQSKEDDNILFVGASTRPGNGVPLVLLGSKQVAKKAISKIKSYVPESV